MDEPFAKALNSSVQIVVADQDEVLNASMSDTIASLVRFGAQGKDFFFRRRKKARQARTTRPSEGRVGYWVNDIVSILILYVEWDERKMNGDG